MIKKEEGRFYQLDFLKAIAIVVVILIHVLANRLNQPFFSFLWNWLHFVVVFFVFCSGYILTAKYQNYNFNLKNTMFWFIKRIKRLVAPFYLYLFLHYFLWFLLPQFFSGLGLKKDARFFIQSLIFSGGVDLNWLVLLFLQLTFLFPLFIFLSKKKKWQFFTLSFSFLFGLLFIFYRPKNYRWLMWLSWSGVFFLSMLVFSKRKKDNFYFLKLAGFSLVISLSLFFIFLPFPFILFAHKYPPDSLYLFYGLTILFFLLFISKLKIIENNFFKKGYQIVSKNSYYLYFFSYIFLDLFETKTKKLNFSLNPFIESALIFFLSLIVILIVKLIIKNTARFFIKSKIYFKFSLPINIFDKN